MLYQKQTSTQNRVTITGTYDLIPNYLFLPKEIVGQLTKLLCHPLHKFPDTNNETKTC